MKKRTARFLAFGMIVIAAVLCGAFVANAADVTLVWDANSEEDLDGYKLYYKLDTSGVPYDGSGLNEGDSPVTISVEDLSDESLPEYTLSGLGDGELYYFALTAFDTDGMESDYSEEVSYEAPEAIVYYTITASMEGQGGSISPEGTVSVAEGSSQTFSFVADSYYSVSDVIVDGVSVGAVSSYTFEDISASHTIEVVFVNPPPGAPMALRIKAE